MVAAILHVYKHHFTFPFGKESVPYFTITTVIGQVTLFFGLSNPNLADDKGRPEYPVCRRHQRFTQCRGSGTAIGQLISSSNKVIAVCCHEDHLIT